MSRASSSGRGGGGTSSGSSGNNGLPKSSLVSGDVFASTTITLDASPVTSGKFGRLLSVTLSSPGFVKITIQRIEGFIPTDISTIILTPAESVEPIQFNAAHVIAGNGSNHFAVKVTNLDDSSDTTAYATIEWLEGATAQQVSGGSGGGGSTFIMAANQYGTATGVGIAITATITSYLSAGSTFLRGFIARGTVDGDVFIEVNGSRKYFGRINIVAPSIEVILPDPELLSSGTTASLRVTNIGEAIGDYEGTLLLGTQ